MPTDPYEVSWHLCDYDEPQIVGSCDECDGDLYDDDVDGLCEECARVADERKVTMNTVRESAVRDA